MQTPTVARHRAPYGLSFQVAELVFIRDWATRRGLSMAVLLDQVFDGAEFEELVLLHGRGTGRRALTLWRTAGSVVTQAAGAQPRAFTSIHPAMNHFVGLLEPFPSVRRRRRGRVLQLLWRRIIAAAGRRGPHM